MATLNIIYVFLSLMFFCDALGLIGLSTELAEKFSVIAFLFFWEKEREGKCLRAVSLQNEMVKCSKN